MAVSFGRRCAASLLLDQDFRLIKRADIVGAFVGYTNFHRLSAFVARSRIEVQAVAAGVKIRSAVLALVGGLDLVQDLDLRRAVVAARDQMEARFDAACRALGPRRRLGLPLAI